MKPVREISLTGSPVAKCTDNSLDVYNICSCAKTFLFCVQSELQISWMLGRRDAIGNDGGRF